MSLTKLRMAQHLMQTLGLPKEQATALVEQFFCEIADSLVRGESVRLAGFGKFELRDKKERPGRNLKTGEPVPIKARRVVTFRTSPTLKRRFPSPDEGSVAPHEHPGEASSGE